MSSLYQWFWFTLTSVVLSQNCLNLPFTVTFENNGITSKKIRLPRYIRHVEIATLKNGTIGKQYKLDESVFNDPTKTMVNRELSGIGSYSVNLDDFPTDNKTYFVICLSMNVARNGNLSSCRICKLTTLCQTCPLQFLTVNTRTYSDGSGEIEMISNLTIRMNVECSITSRNVETYNPYNPYDNPQSYYYYGMVTPSPYNYGYTSYPYGNPSYGYNNNPVQCPNRNNTINTPKTKLQSNALTLIKIDNLKSSRTYEMWPKFEIDWQGKAPLNWPDSLPIIVDVTDKHAFTMGAQCPML